MRSRRPRCSAPRRASRRSTSVVAPSAEPTPIDPAARRRPTLRLVALAAVLSFSFALAACAPARAPEAATSSGTTGSAPPTTAAVAPTPVCPPPPQPGPDPAVITPPADAVTTDPMLAATAALRCLPQATAATEFVGRDAARALIDAAVTDEDRAEIDRITPIATLLGWIDPGDDLLAEARALSGGLVLGLYATSADRLYVVTDGAALTPTAQRTLVHEWVHALQDDSYGLDTLRDDVPDDDLDRAAALSAVIEGDAEYTSQRYTQRWFDEAKRRAATDEELSLGGSLGAEVTRGPLLWDLYFPYLYGPAFVRGIVEGTGRPGNGLGGGRSDAAVGGPSDARVGREMAELYGRLPVTSTEILHPERYRAGFRPETVPSPALADVLGPGWTQTFDGTWGEYATANLIAGFSGASAGGELTVVDGWRGDDLAVWRSPTGAAALALSTRWADAASAERFADRLRTAMGFRGIAGTEAAGGTGAGTWRFDDGRTCRVAVDGRASLVTCTDDAAAASASASLTPEAAPQTVPPR